MTGLDGVVDAGLLGRFRTAGAEIQWRETKAGSPKGRRPGPRVRIAHLHDEEARVEEHPDGSVVVDSGPVGALVLLLTLDRKGPGGRVTAHEAGALPGFGQGALRAGWKERSKVPAPLPIADLVGLARYALA